MSHPFQFRIPKQFQSLKTILILTYEKMQKSQLFMIASSQAYTTLLSLVPLIAVSFAVFTWLGGTKPLFEKVQSTLLSHLTTGASDNAIAYLNTFIKNTDAGAIGIGGFVVLLFTGVSLLSSADRAINRVWHRTGQRKWWIRLSSYLLLIILGPIGFSITVGVLTSKSLPLSSVLPNSLLMFAISVLFFFLIYRFVPNGKVHVLSAGVSALFASILFNLARYGYAIYTAKVLTYNRIYGSLGAIPIIMLWVYIAWVIVLGGAALSAAIDEYQEKKGR